MSHLSRDERLLAVDDVLEAPRAAHLAACEGCRAEVEALRGVVARVRAVDVPEPSPLFWDHLAARVGDAIRAGAATGARACVGGTRRSGGGDSPRSPSWPPAARMWRRAPPATPAVAVLRSGPATGARAGATPALSATSTEAGDERDEGWGLIAAMADETDLTPGDATALAPLAGQSELSISQLSRDERAALIAELEAELAPRSGREG
jgi:hypothetical protein